MRQEKRIPQGGRGEHEEERTDFRDSPERRRLFSIIKDNGENTLIYWKSKELTVRSLGASSKIYTY